MFAWQSYQHSLSSRAVVLNHYLLPALIYFLSCWQPVKYQLNRVFSLARSFLWGHDPEQARVPKVAWDTCLLPRNKGGLGIFDLSRISTKLAGKWIMRATDSEDYWAILLKRNIAKFELKEYKAWWSNLNLREIVMYPKEVVPYGSKLVCKF